MIEKNKILSLAIIGVVLGGILGALVDIEQVGMYSPTRFPKLILGPAHVFHPEVRRAFDPKERILEEKHVDGPVAVHYNRSYPLRVYVIRPIK